MIVPSTILRRPASIFFLLFAFVCLLSLLSTDAGSTLRIINPFGNSRTAEELTDEKPLFASTKQDATPSRAEFISSSSRVELPQFNPAPIQRMCSEEPSWSNDLVLECSEGLGGLNNVRQQMLTCVRWAIEFRAALILPTIRPRLETNSSEAVVHQYTGPRESDILFDQQTFTERLREGCPQMMIYDNLTSASKLDHIGVGTIYPPKGTTREQMQSFRTNWVNEHPVTDGKVRIAHLRRFATQYDICYDGVEFADAFGQLLPLRKDTHRLAAAVLYELSNRFHLNFDPNMAINPDVFLGIHLRTSSDAVKEGWMGYEEQAAMYQKYASSYGLPAIYVASGNLSSTEIFTKSVSPTPVVTKTSLLSGEDLSTLNSMSWDQQAEVDYLVLLRASRFLGMSDSSFSWAVAVARRTGEPEGTCGAWQEGKAETPPESGIALKDELSVVIGAPSKYHFGPRSWP